MKSANTCGTEASTDKSKVMVNTNDKPQNYMVEGKQL